MSRICMRTVVKSKHWCLSPGARVLLLTVAAFFGFGRVIRMTPDEMIRTARLDADACAAALAELIEAGLVERLSSPPRLKLQWAAPRKPVPGDAGSPWQRVREREAFDPALAEQRRARTRERVRAYRARAAQKRALEV
jgi:hypothetical protein